MGVVKLTLEYDGTGFSGWAAQPGLRTVEGDLRSALDDVYPSWDALSVAGRTDAGVHALGQVASFSADGGPPPERAAAALNGVLPDDVAVVTSEAAPDGFSARFSAVGRSYRYRVWRRAVHSPLERRRSFWFPRPVDEEALAASAALLRGERDFRAFTPTETQHESFVASSTTLPGVATATCSRSRSPRTASSGTWCGRSSGRCWSSRRSRSGGCSRGARARRRARRRRPGASTSRRSIIRR